MLALRLPKDIEERLDALAKSTGWTKSYLARQAILEKIEDLEDIALAMERLNDPEAKWLSLEEVYAVLDADKGETPQQAAE